MRRRTFLRQIGAGALTLAAGGVPLLARAGQEPDLDLELTAHRDTVNILEGQPTRTWRFSGRVLQGPADALTDMPGSYLGPIIRVRKGQRVRIRFRNDIPEPSIVHWHGLHVPADMDGHPRLAVDSGREYLYEFTVRNRAGTYWYHPHPHGRTGHQVYGGMAGLLIVSDDAEDGLGLPSGAYDVPLVIQDRTFDQQNQLVYLRVGHERMTGFLGERIMVNGSPEPTMDFEPRPYRLRILNGSNSRICHLAWNDGTPLTVIGTDGGLLDTPVPMESVMLGPGERLDLWENFGEPGRGRSRRLVSRPFNGWGTSRVMRGVIPNGAPFDILATRVGSGDHQAGISGTFPHVPSLNPADAVNVDAPKRFRIEMSHMVGLINGRRFEMTGVAPDEIVAADTVEIWEFDNPLRGRGMMAMPMPHPMHLHGRQFQVLGRTGGDGTPHMDLGWKDTVLVMPGQRVRIAVPFGEYPGLFLYHCHNLEHEDMGMMRNYRVEAPG